MDSVKVALRIRPLVNSELEIGCRSCIEHVPKEPQISIGKSNQLFTYNYVFDENEGQSKVYDIAVKPMIDNLFKGYNVTILAYGQTGSGKTYTMGTNYSGDGELGVIPRAIYDIYDKVASSPDQNFRITVSFIELYNENLFDLLTQRPREQSIVDMRDHGSGVCIPGLTELDVTTPEETLERLKEGSLGRVVGSTAMNAQSSRSHAIFTINIRITPKENPNEMKTSKFHLVDLAGSERSKKTGTTGDRFREGVNINKGLLVLGNVISQLGEGNQGFINYRDSKLTRLLQDSLGGNSVTLMIACISPADYNQDETMSTLRYADRARKIKNKPIVNQDPQLAELNRLRKENEELRLKLIGEGKSFECPPEHKELQVALCDSHKKLNQLSKALSEALTQNANMFEKALSIENAEASFKDKFQELISLSETLPEDDLNCKQFKEKLSTLQDEQKKVESEIFSFDKSAGEQQSEEKDEEVDDESETQNGTITLLREEHIINQSKKNKELMTLTKDLMWKEELMAKLTENTGQLDQMQGVSQVNVDELKKEIADLQQEKEELLRQIRLNSNSQNNSAKVAETRRKRLQELEAKVSALSKKVVEQERVIKMKEKADAKILALKEEILGMKQMKVKLIHEMKNENEKFKNFKAEKDREVCQLRNQNIKKQNQLKKMEQMHTQQQNVLRRKLEAAAAANKRIMAALERQRTARERKGKVLSNEKIKERMLEELELLESEHQAQKSLESLLLDRAFLTKKYADIKETLNNSTENEEKKRLMSDLKQVEQDLELRSAEISDLQQKLLDIHQDDRSRNNWEVLQSMADAKFALNFLFNLVSEKLKENLDKSILLLELKEQQTETDHQLTEYQQKLEALQAYHKKAIEKLEKECEEKVYVFMKLTAENMEQEKQLGPISETIKKQIEEFENLEHLRKRIAELEEENASLMSDKNTTFTKDPFQKFLQEKMNGTFVLPDRKKKSNGNHEATFTLADEELLKTFDDSFEVESDDPDKDPDWRNTPIHKRIEALKVGSRKAKLGKRQSKDEKCNCIEICEKDCACFKSCAPCNENCSCDRLKCSGGPKRQRSSRIVDFCSDQIGLGVPNVFE